TLTLPLSLHDALPIFIYSPRARSVRSEAQRRSAPVDRRALSRQGPVPGTRLEGGAAVDRRALPPRRGSRGHPQERRTTLGPADRSEEHTSELQSPYDI